MIGANLAESLSFLCRRSDEWCDVLMSTVSSSGNSRQRASPTPGSTSCIINCNQFFTSAKLCTSIAW